ncbi:hypothetical protein ABKN59_007720 [Abortiporus biennis]
MDKAPFEEDGDKGKNPAIISSISIKIQFAKYSMPYKNTLVVHDKKSTDGKGGYGRRTSNMGMKYKKNAIGTQ